MASSELIDAYLAGIETLSGSVDGLTPEQLRARPIPGKWSTLETVCHLADTEGLFAERMKRVLAEDRPPLLYAEPDAFISALACDQRDVAEELAVIAAVRNQMARILRAQAAGSWERIGIHNKAGEQTLEQLLCKAIRHLEHHVEFIREKRAVLK